MYEIIPFDITEYLDNDEAIAEYLSQVLEDGDNEEFIRAIGHIVNFTPILPPISL